MLEYRYDAVHALAVMVLAPPTSETDIDEYVACVKRLDAVGADHPRAALALVIADGYPLPGADARRRGVDARKNMVSRPVVAVVTTSPLVRAAIAASRWISPPPYEQRVLPTFEEAVTFIEAKRGPTLRILDRMYDEANAALALRRKL